MCTLSFKISFRTNYRVREIIPLSIMINATCHYAKTNSVFVLGKERKKIRLEKKVHGNAFMIKHLCRARKIHKYIFLLWVVSKLFALDLLSSFGKQV